MLCFSPRNAVVNEATSKIPYVSCQGQLGESIGSKDARNPNAQKAANPSATIDAMMLAKADRRDSAIAAINDRPRNPTVMSRIKCMRA
ncbi:MAG: hypothetical protein ACI9SQ_001810 [Rubritalea sp.]|jgi:hypothetical protein|tara:strand:- start:208 stop:471 length:264 start_codon:yes stop_codon:yes gene_type:complete